MSAIISQAFGQGEKAKGAITSTNDPHTQYTQRSALSGKLERYATRLGKMTRFAFQTPCALLLFRDYHYPSPLSDDFFASCLSP